MDLGSLLDVTREALSALGGTLATPFLDHGQISSLASLLAAFVVGLGYLAFRQMSRRRRLRLRVLLRAQFRTFRWRPTLKADLFYFILNAFLLGAILGGALLSFAAVSGATGAVLVRLFGVAPTPVMPELAARIVITLALFLAYEFGYWVDHWLSHRVAFLWDFHKVHHSAEELTPLTVWRVHPIESLKFANILALSTGVTSGIGHYGLGADAHEYAVSGTNVILVGFIYAYLHLQHTHLWIPFGGLLGRLLQSPAHHQIHHSSHPRHHNRNFGSCLAVWDWAFGTLYVPGREPEKLHFGIDARHAHDHSMMEILVRPFILALSRIPRALRKRHLDSLVIASGAKQPRS